jgi:uncharacterized coiled-coil DUF342 family protein
MDNDRPISVLKSELNKFDEMKEAEFAKSKAHRQKMHEVAESTKKLKNERNQLTDSVKKIKQERDELNKILKEKIEAFKKIAPKKTDSKKPKVNVSQVKKEIKDMEYKIETEALTFDKEQKLMKIIKEKRKSIEGMEPTVYTDEMKKLSTEIDELRKQADAKHQEAQQKASESQVKHEEAIKFSNELKTMQAEQKELDKNCSEYKTKVHDVNEQLKTKLEEHVTHAKEHTERRERKQDKKPYKPHINVEEMQHKAEEKLKKGQKLTTEDLLAFQKQ